MIAPLAALLLQCCTVTLHVTVPQGTGTLYLAGSLAQLGSWSPNGLALTGRGAERSANLSVPSGTSFEFKFTLGSWDREALTESGSLTISSPAYRRGVQFLLNSQLEDGSWYVRTRTLPVQPYFDSDFPHARDQFISAAATNWATIALGPAARQLP